MATVVVREAGRCTYIMSTDRDFYQLVTASVSILNTQRKPGEKIIGPDDIREDISYPIDTKSLGIRGGWDLKPVDYDHEVTWNGYETTPTRVSLHL